MSEEKRIIRASAHYYAMEATLGVYALPNVKPERRFSERFPLELPAELHVDGLRLSGQTINISSGGLLVKCDGNFQPGTVVTVRLEWPIRQRTRPVTLIVCGEVVRREPGRIAIQRQQYDFIVASHRSMVRSQN